MGKWLASCRFSLKSIEWIFLLANPLRLGNHRELYLWVGLNSKQLQARPSKYPEKMRTVLVRYEPHHGVHF